MSPSSTASSSTGIDSEDEQTWDDWQDEQPMKATSLFSDRQFDSAAAAMRYDRDEHGIDVCLLASTLDFFERIRLINWIRTTKPEASSLKRLDRNADFLQDDQYLKPVLEDDALLQFDFDHLTLAESSSSALDSDLNAVASTSTSNNPNQIRDDLLDNLRAQLYDQQSAIDKLKSIIRERLGASMGLDSIPTGTGQEGEKGKRILEQVETERDDDTHYFEVSCFSFPIHGGIKSDLGGKDLSF